MAEQTVATMNAQRLEALNEIAHVVISGGALHEMLQGVVTSLGHRFDWQFVGCALIDWDRHESECAAVFSTYPTPVHPGYRLSLNTGVVGKVALQNKPVKIKASQLADNPLKLGEFCMPINVDNRVIAVLDINTADPESLRKQIVFLQTICELIAGAIIAARRTEELRQHAELMEVLSDVSRLAFEAEDLTESLQQLVDYIARVFPVEICSILLLNEAGTHFAVEAYSGSMELKMPEGDEWPVSVGICGRAVRENREQLVTDIDEHPDYVSGNIHVQSEFVVPIRFRDRILGCLNLESARRDCFTPYSQVVFRHLANQLAGAINLSTVNHQLEEANQKFQSLSFTDHLTGLANRRRFDETLNAEWRRAKRAKQQLAVLLIDIDSFKQLNDNLGHQMGDECLKMLATTLRDNLRMDIDLIARYGGEEFSVILPDTDLENARRVAEKLRIAIEQCAIEHLASPVADVVTASIGVAATIPGTNSSPDELVNTADRNLYLAKQSGRNRIAG